MMKKSTLGLLLSALAAATTGCPEPNPTPADARTDSPDVTDVQGDTAQDDGAGDVGDDGPASCGDTRFISPMPDAVLGIADDADRNCDNGFATTVTVSTNAPVGSTLSLLVNGLMAREQQVAGSVVRFTNVMLDNSGMQTLQVRQNGVSSVCATANVVVSCNLPRCQITAPARSTLNEADNATPGMPFTTGFTVSTDIEDGRDVELFVSNRTTALRAAVMGGMAQFRGVGLSPDGVYRVRAQCTNRAGNTGMSAESSFTVDATPPTLMVARPMMGATIGFSSDTNSMAAGVQFQVCGRSNEMGQQLCAGPAGTSMPTCATVMDTGADTCVELNCPTGNAPFNIEVTARDAAGNVTRRTINDIRCQSTLPSVRVVAPLAYDPMNAATILNASRDADPMARGLQADVVACTDRSTGMASLYLNGEMTTAVAGPVAVSPTMTGDPCAMLGMGFVGIVRFPRVTLPETTPPPVDLMAMVPENPTLTVAVTDGGDIGRSTPVRVYVDSNRPVTSVLTCGLLVTPGTDGTGTADIDVISDAYPVTLTLTPTGGMPTTRMLAAPSSAGGRGRFSMVRFTAGITALTATATDPAGNTTTSTAMCNVEVGNTPSLAFTAPTPGQQFNTATPVTVTLRTDAPVGTSVSLTVGSTSPRSATVAAGGTVTFTGVTLPDGDAVVLTAATADVPGRGVGRATVTITVDTQAPTVPTMLAVAVPTTPASARRAGTLRLTWLDASDPAPSGGTRAVTRYDVRVSTSAITTANFVSATAVTTTATPGMPGASNQTDITGLRLGQQYWVAIRAIDRAGLVSSTIASAGPITIDLVRDTVTDVPVSLGADVSGGFDVNGDAYADVVVGSGITASTWGGVARVYFGSATGISATRYAEFRGVSANRFGSSAVSLGDVNGDGIGDIAVGEPGPTALTALAPGAVYIFFGRRTWNPPTTPYGAGNADVVLEGGTGEFATASLGVALARVGDFNGDGLNDIAASAPQANSSRGAVIVVFGRMTFPATIAPAAADVVIRNSSTETLFGRALAGGGRLVGGDTREDLIIGYGAASSNGFVAVFGGRAATAPASLTLADAALNRAGVATTPANLGQFAVGGVGDINGDGRSDLAIGTAVRGPGQVTLYFGDASGGLTAGPVITSPSTADSDVFGIRIASVTAPTFVRPSLLLASPSGADLLAGAAAFYGNDPRVYIFLGRSSWTGLTVSSAESGVMLSGAASQPVSGLNWVGDVDGDGYVDAAVGRASGAGTMIVVR